ncbi:MAG: LytTR family DNA-binding domain-containing protein, partial [Defluviitaleaceae bacterium]|nr:LytTR family DNA-binding domain-containing protein [Defluviitaleaceae bacterium]MCL2240650.1 LytTR family DNA-binding domain-containing protein [Defluviitaleaceae bacterium]
MLDKCVKDCILMEDYDMESALSTADPNDIIDYIKDNPVNGLYILDVELDNGDNGVELARQIRQYDPRGFIAFVTAHPHYIQKTFEYQVEAMAYIQKSDDEKLVCKKVAECMKNAYSKHISRAYATPFIFKSANGRTVSCEYGDILYFETDAQKGVKRILLHTKARQYTFYGTINELTATLPKGQFFRCHKSAIVNVGNLTEDGREDLMQGKDRMLMPNGTECP